MNTNQKGFASTVFIIALVVILAGGLGYIELTQKSIRQNADQSSETKNLDSAWKAYTDAKFGYTMQYPTNWSITSYPDVVYISSSDFRESDEKCEQEACEVEPAVLAGARFEIHVGEISGSAEDFMNLQYSTLDQDNVAFKSHRWTTVDGRKTLVTEYKKWLEPMKGASQRIRVSIPNDSQLTEAVFKFDSFDKENEEIFAKFLVTFDIK